MNIIIPMAGLGSRFATAGYTKPKPFIDVLGTPMIVRVLDNLSIEGARFIALARAEHLQAERKTIDHLQKTYQIDFIPIDQLTEGAACTVLHAHRLIDNNDPLLIANSDQIVVGGIEAYIKDAEARQLDGSIMTFHANATKWSYAKVDEKGFVIEVKEKVPISEHATVGLYYFKKGSSFVNAAIDMIVRNERVNNEFYVCPVYNKSIMQGEKIGIFKINASSMFGTGTPEDLDIYIKHLQQEIE
ncbi:MAG: glycosyltransferase family 2 protein [Deltaproteobacteria bacterium]|nr:glycosyltransferase family 2 protein [Deltaproteobacteria bacterium]